MGEWLTILIVLLILGILLDGWRRMRNAQKDSLRVSRTMGSTSTSGARDRVEAYGAELPNGGARVVAYRETPEDERPFHRPPVDELDDDLPAEDADEAVYDEPWDDGMAAAYEDDNAGWTDADEDPEPLPAHHNSEPAPTAGRGRIPQQVALNLDESVPMLMETEGEPEYGDDNARVEPTVGESLDLETETNARRDSPSEPPLQKPLETNTADDRRARTNPAPEAELQRTRPLQRGERELQREREPQGDQDPQRHHQEPRPEPAAAAKAPSARPAPEPEEVLVINVMAPAGEQFRGDALLESVLASGLRYGDMNIFHRYERPRGGGAILYSLANMVKPGVFDLEAMEDFTTPGISLFMTLPLERPVEQENVEVFDEMLEAARAIATALGGELKDENRSVLTRQTQEHCRQRIHEFERKQLSRPSH